MRKLFFILIATLLFKPVFAQFPLYASYSVSLGGGSDFFVTKFSSAGYKYVTVDYINSTINIFNLNHTSFKTFTFAANSTHGTHRIMYISDQLFNANSSVEYVMFQYSGSGLPDVTVRDEAGTLIFFEDSVHINNDIHTDLLG